MPAKTTGPVLKSAGYDSLYVDLEHGNLSIPEAGQLCVAALACGIAPFVRIPAGATDGAAKLLDLGAMGIIAPHIGSVADAERMVAACKYLPIGTRSASASLPQNLVLNLPLKEARDRVNEETMVCAMIESKSGLDNVEGIAAVRGIDVLLVGTSDLSIELGIPGQFNSDVILKAFERILAAAKKNGKYVSIGGGIKGAATLMKTLCDMGVRQISVGNDVGMMRAGMSQKLKEARALMA